MAGSGRFINTPAFTMAIRFREYYPLKKQVKRPVKLPVGGYIFIRSFLIK